MMDTMRKESKGRTSIIIRQPHSHRLVAIAVCSTGGLVCAGVECAGCGGVGIVRRAPATDVVDNRLNDGVVECLRTLGVRELQPEDEGGLDGEVIGNIVQDEAESHALEEGEETEDGPVGQPLDVVLMTRRLEGAIGEVGWERPSDEVRDGESERVDEDGRKEDCAGTESAVSLGHLGLFLELDHDWVSGELLVELANVLGEALARLLDGGMRFDLLGHVRRGGLRLVEARTELGPGIRCSGAGVAVLGGRHFFSREGSWREKARVVVVSLGGL